MGVSGKIQRARRRVPRQKERHSEYTSAFLSFYIRSMATPGHRYRTQILHDRLGKRLPPTLFLLRAILQFAALLYAHTRRRQFRIRSSLLRDRRAPGPRANGITKRCGHIWLRWTTTCSWTSSCPPTDAIFPESLGLPSRKLRYPRCRRRI